MGRTKPVKKKGARWARLAVIVALLAAIGAFAWNYLRPLVIASDVTTYDEYTVEQGDISTVKSFSASINVLKSETLSNVDEVTTFTELYVESGQEVKENDKLFLLSTGKLYRASIDGTVNEMRFGEGDYLWPNLQLIQICDLTHLQVALQVDEYDIEKVSIGQKCTVTIVALGLDFETEIAHINRVSSASGSVAYYSVTAELTVPENVLPGMAASVSIPSDEVSGVPTLPMAALAYDDDKKPYVLRKNGETYDKVTVETGLSDGMKVEIKSGLSAGDVVYAESGSETVAAAFSLVDLYKRVAGETVVINDMSSGRGGRGSGMPEGMADGSFTPQDGTDFTLPDGTSFTPPDGTDFTLPDGTSFTPPDGATSGADATNSGTPTDGASTADSDAPADSASPTNGGTPTATDGSSAAPVTDATDATNDSAVQSTGERQRPADAGEARQQPTATE